MRKLVILVIAALAAAWLGGCEGLGRGIYEGTQTRDRTAEQDRDANPTVEQQPTYEQYKEGTGQK